MERTLETDLTAFDEPNTLDFAATSQLWTTLQREPVSHAHQVVDNTRTVMGGDANQEWISVPNGRQAVSTVNSVTKHPLQLGTSHYDIAKEGRVSRMMQSRKQRHVAAIEDFDNKYRKINDMLEPSVVEASKRVASKIAENQEDLKELYKALDDDSLVNLEQAELERVWTDVQEQMQRREGWLKQFENSLEQVEVQRCALVGGELKILAALLLDIGHELAGPIERLVEERQQNVNLIVVDNRRAHADLVARLRRHEIEIEGSLRSEWESRRSAWHKCLFDRAVKRTRTLLSSEGHTHPPKRATLYQTLRNQQKILFERRVQLFKEVNALVPPSLDRKTAAEWTERCKQLDSEQEVEHKQRGGSLRQFERQHYAADVEVIDALREELVGFAEITGSPPPTDAELDEATEPLRAMVEERFKHHLSAVEEVAATLVIQHKYYQDLGAQLSNLVTVMGEICDKYTEDVTVVQDDHGNKMVSINNQFMEQDSSLEQQLEVLVQNMRQDARVESLREQLPKALAILDQIQDGYRTVYSSSVQQTQDYQKAVDALLSGFDKLVTARCGVVKDMPSDWLSEAPPKEVPPPAAPATGGKTPAKAPPPKGKKGKEEVQPVEMIVTHPMKEEEDLVTTKIPLYVVSDIMELPAPTAEEAEAAAAELVAAQAAAGGATPAAASAKEGKPKKMTKEEEAAAAAKAEEDERKRIEEEERKAAEADPLKTVPRDKETGQPYIDALEMPKDILIGVRRRVRRCMLEHVDQCTDSLLAHTREVVEELQQELTVSLDERLRQHKPRTGRTEMDVFEVRESELQAHKGRLDRHVQQLSQRAAGQLKTFYALVKEADDDLEQHLREQAQRETALASAPNSTVLANLQRLAKAASMAFLESSAAKKEQMHELAQECGANLVASNAQYLKSCITFADGGRYNPEEIVEYSARLKIIDEDAAKRVEVWTAEANAVTERHAAAATEALAKFDGSIADVDLDIKFIESVDRDLRAAEMERQMECTANDRAMEELDLKIKHLEQLTTSYASSTLSRDSTARVAKQIKALEEQEGEEQALQPPPLWVQILATLRSLRWRVLAAAEQLECLESKMELTPVEIWPEGEEDECGWTATKQLLIQRRDAAQALALKLADKAADIGGEAGDEESDATAAMLANLVDALDPAMVDEDGPPPPQEGAPPVALLTRVQAIEAKRGAKLQKMCETYYQQKGERVITRPNRIQPTLQEAETAFKAALANTVATASKYIEGRVKYLRSQLARLSVCVGRCSGVAFGDISTQCRVAAGQVLQPLQEEFDRVVEESTAEQAAHKLALKPSLGNPNQTQELADLDNREQQRSSKLVESAKQHTLKNLEVETLQALRFHKLLAHASTVFCQIQDSTVQMEDLVASDDAIVAPRKTLKTLLKEEQRQKAGADNGTVVQGKAFKSKVWPGVPLSFSLMPPAVLGERCPPGLPEDLMRSPTPAPAAAAPGKGDKAPAGKPGAKGGVSASELAAVEAAEKGLMPPLTTLDTPNHVTAIKTRDRTFAQFKLHYTAVIEKAALNGETLVKGEQQWLSQWDKLVESLKAQ